MTLNYEGFYFGYRRRIKSTFRASVCYLLPDVHNNYCFTKITCSCIMIIVIVIVVFVNFSSQAYIFNFHVKTSA